MRTKRIAVGFGKKPKWITTPRPGAHLKDACIPLLILVRDLLGWADTAREGRWAIKRGEVWVDKKPRRDPRYPVGLMDVVEFPKLGKAYRILPAKPGERSFNGLKLKEIPLEEAGIKLCKIRGKRTLRSGFQLNLHDGTNVLVEDGQNYKTKDTLVLELPSRKPKGLLKFERGKLAMVVKGSKQGFVGRVEEVIPSTMLRKSLTKLSGVQTLTDYVFVIGEERPAISL